ncbi:hypothetical protein FQA39_LY16098 [Lamprigera yunnana]|nr:hypothetical protein FQA39_LY16098 [Lamprigera yunnana]
MAKLAIFFLVAVAFQATLAVPSYYEEDFFSKYLNEIQTEVRDLTVFFEKDFPQHPLAVKTVTWQSNKLIEVIEVIINKLREEKFVFSGESKHLNEVLSTLEEVVNTLKQVTIYSDVTNIHELKKYFVITIHTVLERFEKLVALTYNYYPEFRYTLKYLLVDFMTTLRGISNQFTHINAEFQVIRSPRALIKEIHEHTWQFTEILKEFTHPTQIKVALREYIVYVNEIVQKLQQESILGHKEFDIVIHRITNKLREIVFPLMEVMHENTVDMKVFRTKTVTLLFEVVSNFEQLVQLCEDNVLPEELTHFLVKIIYHYYHAVKHVTYEIRFGYKIGFFKPQYYTNEFYSKYGYGLYENDFHRRFYTPYKYEPKMFTPYKYETLFPVQKYDTFFHDKIAKYETPKELVNSVQTLIKRVYQQFEVKEVSPAQVYEFVQILDYILEQLETKVQYNNQLINQIVYKIKEIRSELKEVHNVYEISPRFVRYIEVVALELLKLYENHGFEQYHIKEIVYKYWTFLRTFTYESVNNYHTEKNYPAYLNPLIKY